MYAVRDWILGGFLALVTLYWAIDIEIVRRSVKRGAVDLQKDSHLHWFSNAVSMVALAIFLVLVAWSVAALLWSAVKP